jgi:hypothetical protein
MLSFKDVGVRTIPTSPEIKVGTEAINISYHSVLQLMPTFMFTSGTNVNILSTTHYIMTPKSNLTAKEKIAISKNVRIRSANFEDHIHVKADRKPNWSVGQRKIKRGMSVSYRGRITPRGLEL